jgi:molybdate-binding protein
MDIIKLDVPLFIRLLELAREEIKDDADIHDVAEIVTKLSQQGVIGMEQYNDIIGFMSKQGNDQELERIRKLSGMNKNV